MTLSSYLQKNGIKGVDFAKQIGIHYVSLSRYRNGEIPESEIIARIRDATGGQVTLDDFIPPSCGK